MWVFFGGRNSFALHSPNFTASRYTNRKTKKCNEGNKDNFGIPTPFLAHTHFANLQSILLLPPKNPDVIKSSIRSRKGRGDMKKGKGKKNRSVRGVNSGNS
jgi:hypothetical protein